MSKVYEDRFVVFIDILGFSSLIEDSETSPDIAKNILDVLLSMQPGEIVKFSGSQINYDKVPIEEVQEVEKQLALMNDISLSNTNISVSYFSDCIILSALKGDTYSRQMILEAIRNFSKTMWTSKRILLRGGVCEGKLHHSSNGPVFGPALNRAYEIESKEAVYPRILFDPECQISLEEDGTLKLYGCFFQYDDGRAYLSLASAFAYSAIESMAAIQNAQLAVEHFQQLAGLPFEMDVLVNSYNDNRIKEKYLWLKQESNALIQLKRPWDCLAENY